MYFLYSFVLSLLFLTLLPYFFYLAVRHGKYAGSFKERMGWLPGSLRSDGRKTIWVHSVSVGEFLAARPLIERLKSDLPSTRILVSTTTLAGHRLSRSDSKLFEGAFYFPFDWKFSVRRSLAVVNPSAVIILETELWPNFLRECKRRNIVTVLANGRISPRSFRRYRLVARPFKRAFEDLSLMLMQSEADAARARQLGAPAARVRVCGNLKYDLMGVGGWESGVGDETGANPRPPTPNPTSAIDQRFRLSLSSPHLIVAGSTAPGEEEMLLASLREVRGHSGLGDARLLLAPRHPERFDEVARLIDRSGFTLVRRSDSRGYTSSGGANQRSRASDREVKFEAGLNSSEGAAAGLPDVILLDTIGELASIYRFAAAVFVGGSLVPRGGHNIIEPAAFAKPIIVGTHTENFGQVVSDFAEADALVQTDASALTGELIRLLSNPDQARAMGERASHILLENRGATECTMSAIREVVRDDFSRAFA